LLDSLLQEKCSEVVLMILPDSMGMNYRELT